jgi:hypothetical protein
VDGKCVADCALSLVLQCSSMRRLKSSRRALVKKLFSASTTELQLG